jgi:flagellar protein FliO/FliZ
MIKRIGVGLVGFLFSLSSFANEASKNLDQKMLQSELIDHIMEIAGSLLFIIVAIVAVVWALKYLLRAGLSRSANMKIVGNLPLSAKDKLLLVKVDGVQLLLGVTPGNIQGLHVFEKNNNEVDNIPVKNNSEDSFLTKMQNALNKREA